MNSAEHTLVLIKPDAIARNLVGDIIREIEQKGIKISRMDLVHPSVSLVQEHYQEHKNAPYYGSLVSFMAGSPVVSMVLSGDNIISVVRKLVGATKVEDRDPHSIRGKYSSSTMQNLIHSSDSPESAKREIYLWYPSFKLE